MTDTFLNYPGLTVLRDLLGAQLRAFGTDLELDDQVGAFGAWLDTDRGVVELEFVEQVVDFADGERVESVLEARAGVADGEANDLVGTITGIDRIQDKVALINKLSGEQEWEWWRDSGIRVQLDTGQQLVIHCKSPVSIEVAMLTGPDVQLPTPPRDYQEGEKRRYDYERREVAL
ncbi:MAG: hypothetical protein Q4G50_09460 [Corynebacterium sp.]|uniref:hypothetical protein n=1 Tax=Corynebacterium sp. TaxID=1720 RepID=UPI0026DFEAA8|nr:hypothetical protein [Corynebacterium sp.]MDO5670218.1 hypothetical protein [Corynebacterium sp.]